MWFQRKTATLDAPVPPDDSATPAEPVPDRAEVARRRVTTLHDELTALDNELRTFKMRHKVTASKFGVLLRIECTFEERPAIEREWRALLQRRDRAVAGWHEALHTWSDAKEAAKEKA
jgi:hypothetical protein